MEDLMSRMQMADSTNQYNPFYPGEAVMDQPCVERAPGQYMSRVPNRIGLPDQFVVNPPPERSRYMQFVEDPDVVARGSSSRSKKEPHYPQTVGSGASDFSRGQMFLPSAGDMPVVRKVVMFDTRFRNPEVTPTASRVLFSLDQPICSVSRIAVVSARVPICLDPANDGLLSEDYAMLSVGVNLPDIVPAVNYNPLALVPQVEPQPPYQPVTPSGASPAYARALAYVTLSPMHAGSSFAGFEDNVNSPHRYYTDFLKPIPSLEKIELSWWRFLKDTTVGAYNIPNSHAGEVGDVNENAFVMLAFFCKNRRPE